MCDIYWIVKYGGGSYYLKRDYYIELGYLENFYFWDFFILKCGNVICFVVF